MSTAAIHTLASCPATMLEMLEHLFNADDPLTCRMEIAWTGDTRTGRTSLSNARTFLYSERNDAVSQAVSVNEQGCNVYVGAQRRHMDSPHIGRCKDEHAAGLTCAYIDLDEPGAVENALRVVPSLKPSLTVITGARPHLRAQLWWRLDAVCTDQQRVIQLLKGMAQAFNGDPTVTNPSRVMRLPGSIAWPVKEGRVAEMTYIQDEPNLMTCSIEELERAYPYTEAPKLVPRPQHGRPIVAPTQEPTIAEEVASTQSLTGLTKLRDGRESYLRDTVYACLIEFTGQNRALPTEQELFEVVWPQYQSKVDLRRPGRGEDEARYKCQRLVARAVAGQLPGLGSLDDIIAAYRARFSKPEIYVKPGEMPRVIDEIEHALVQHADNYYQRGSLIVRPGIIKMILADGSKVAAQRLMQVNAHHLAEVITHSATLLRFNMDARKWLPIDCTLRIADTYLARAGRWRLPVLSGLINAPTLRADGSILDEPGYDPQTGILFNPEDTEFPVIVREPSRKQAEEALAVLISLIGTFPFVGQADRSVALSALLTALTRRSLPTAPLHAFNAPVAGTGKSILVDLASVIATGRNAAVIAQGKTEEVNGEAARCSTDCWRPAYFHRQL